MRGMRGPLPSALQRHDSITQTMATCLLIAA